MVKSAIGSGWTHRNVVKPRNQEYRTKDADDTEKDTAHRCPTPGCRIDSTSAVPTKGRNGEETASHDIRNTKSDELTVRTQRQVGHVVGRL